MTLNSDVEFDRLEKDDKDSLRYVVIRYDTISLVMKAISKRLSAYRLSNS